jgi:acetoacetyl-CoA synthetase
MPLLDHEILWRPTETQMGQCQLGRFGAWVKERRGTDFGAPPEYDAIWRWSTDHLDEFWSDFATWADVVADVPVDAVLADPRMPGAVWFPEVTINYAEHALRAHDTDGPALIALGENRDRREISWEELRGNVGAFAHTLRQLGVEPGDRVVGYLPNAVEAIVAFLGSAAVGAIWSLCAPDFGASAALARFAQIEPKVLVTTDGYRFNGKSHDRRQVVAQLRAELPSLEATIAVPALSADEIPEGAMGWHDAVGKSREPEFERLAFDHPLWIVYSSGTTGLPKGIVHGHGGIVLEQRKQAALHNDIAGGDRFYWYSSAGWIMWNISISALLAGATVVLYDGAPAFPELDSQFALCDQVGINYFGTSAGYLSACERSGCRPGDDHDLSALRSIGSTGSPLARSTFHWVYDCVKRDVFLTSSSGGTDIASGFIGGNRLLPITAGEMQRPMLGVAVESWNDRGEPVVGELGELVVTKPMPSMPLQFYNDPHMTRYRESYFEPWPGVWRHGDWLEITPRGTCIISGRSDSTLNRGGVRIGTAEVYAALDGISEIVDCVVLGIEQPDGGYWMPLFVQLRPGDALTAELVARVRAAIREKASPRHAPDEVIVVPGIPYTRTGKRLEVPLKRLFQGVDPERAINLGAVADPEAVEYYVALARARAGGERSLGSPNNREERS